MSEPQKKILDELQDYNREYTDAYWDIFNNKEALPADQQECMRAELRKNYERTVALSDGQPGLEQEREIAELEKQRLIIKEEARLREEEIKAEYRIKHAKLTAQTDLKSEIIKKEFEIRTKAETETLEIKREQIVPVKEELPRHWWQRLFRRPVKYYTNYAYDLASQKADLEAEEYLSDRESEILKLEAKRSGTDELELAVIKVMNDYIGGKTRGRKAKILNKALPELIEPICKMFARRERALTELIDCLSANDNNAFEEPSEQEPMNDEELKPEEDREELQSRAVSLLTAFCQKRIDELQQEQIKPKRKRVRKTHSQSGQVKSDD